jgi:O-acetylhomoserine (thiol)-lyase
LEQSPKVAKVHYPGLASSPYFQTAEAQFSGGFGSLLTFQLHSRAACFELLDRCKIIRRATNVHDNKTLLIHPASTIFCEYSPDEKAEMAVSEEMLRLSVGIEDPEDLLEDLAAALESP